MELKRSLEILHCFLHFNTSKERITQNMLRRLAPWILIQNIIISIMGKYSDDWAFKNSVSWRSFCCVCGKVALFQWKINIPSLTFLCFANLPNPATSCPVRIKKMPANLIPIDAVETSWSLQFQVFVHTCNVSTYVCHNGITDNFDIPSARWPYSKAVSGTNK